ncbi:MAG: DUF1223 domain-containing protein [Fuerstiella sp.]
MSGKQMSGKISRSGAGIRLKSICCAAVVFAIAMNCSWAMGQDGIAGDVQQAVLVELFTSEGCSSCPPADDNLKRLHELAEENGYPIYTLSYHVDYWDYLGWKDRFSSAAATKRQRRYSAAFGLNRIYTPQFVVNGQWEFVGSNRAKTRAAILKAMDERVPAEIQATAKAAGDKVDVQLTTAGLSKGDRVVIALALKSAKSKVTRGENARRTLDHIHVVRDFKEVLAANSVTASFTKPADFKEANYHVLAYAQSAKTLELVGIQEVEIKTGDGA